MDLNDFIKHIKSTAWDMDFEQFCVAIGEFTYLPGDVMNPYALEKWRAWQDFTHALPKIEGLLPKILGLPAETVQ